MHSVCLNDMGKNGIWGKPNPNYHRLFPLDHHSKLLHGHISSQKYKDSQVAVSLVPYSSKFPFIFLTVKNSCVQFSQFLGWPTDRYVQVHICVPFFSPLKFHITLSVVCQQMRKQTTSKRIFHLHYSALLSNMFSLIILEKYFFLHDMHNGSPSPKCTNTTSSPGKCHIAKSYEYTYSHFIPFKYVANFCTCIYTHASHTDKKSLVYFSLKSDTFSPCLFWTLHWCMHFVQT